MILFVPDSVRRAIRRMRSALPDSAWEVEYKGVFRTVVRARVTLGTHCFDLDPLSSGELSAELRALQDDEIDALAAFRVTGGGPAAALARAAAGWLREEDSSPTLRGLALCALVARVRAESEDYEGREEEPARLLAWLERHGAEIALSEEERTWLAAPIDALPDEAQYASLPERFASHAYALGLVPGPEAGDLPDLMSRFGFLSEQLPAGLAATRLRPGREQYLA